MTKRSLMATALTAAAIVLLAACASANSSRESSDTAAKAAKTRLVRIVKHAPWATGITFDNRGRLVYLEKNSGRIIRVSHGKRHVLARLHVFHGIEEDGLLGLAIDSKGRYYASYTTDQAVCPNPTTSHPTSNSLVNSCVWRFKLAHSGRRLRADKLIFYAPHPSPALNHVGGGIHFGPDHALYISIGDLGQNDDPNKGPSRAQNVNVPFGKILRVDPNGTNKPAAGNPGYCYNADNTVKRPVGDDLIYACGIRNVFEFAFARDGKLWDGEAGDSCDEINIVKAGVNYGWQPPRTDCSGSGPGKPVVKTTGTPAGIDVWESRSAGSWRGDVFYCLFSRNGALIRLIPKTRRTQTIRGAAGHCMLDLTAGTRGLYFSDGESIYRLSRV